jgi:hypothetical protein
MAYDANFEMSARKSSKIRVWGCQCKSAGANIYDIIKVM